MGALPSLAGLGVPCAVLPAEALGIPLLQKLGVRPSRTAKAEMPFNQGSCNEFSVPVKVLSGSMVWTCVKCTFKSLVPLLIWAGFFLKQFPNPAFPREIARTVSTGVFWIPWLLILHRPADKRSVYAWES